MKHTLDFEIFAEIEIRGEMERKVVARFYYWLDCLDYAADLLNRGAPEIWLNGGAYEMKRRTAQDFPNSCREVNV